MAVVADGHCWACGDPAPAGICGRTDHGDPLDVLRRGVREGHVEGISLPRSGVLPCPLCGVETLNLTSHRRGCLPFYRLRLDRLEAVKIAARDLLREAADLCPPGHPLSPALRTLAGAIDTAQEEEGEAL